MGEVVGPWADPRFSNLEILTRIAEHDHDAAVGVAMNPAVPDEVVIRLAPKARFSRDNTEYPTERMTTLLCNRGPQAQAAIVQAAGRWPTVQRDMCNVLTPAGAWYLYQLTQTTRFRGAASVETAIKQLSRAGTFAGRYQADAARELALAVSEGPRDRFTLLTLAQSCTTDAHVEALAAHFPTLEDLHEQGYPSIEDLVHAVCLATIGLEHLVRVWAEESPFGVLVAAADPRQDPDWVLSLTIEDPALSSVLEELRNTNPTVSTHNGRERIHATLDIALDAVVAGDEYALHSWWDYTRSATTVALTTRFADMSAEELLVRAEETYSHAGPMTKLAYFLHPNATDDGTWTVDDIEMDKLTPRAVEAVQVATSRRSAADQEQINLYQLTTPIEPTGHGQPRKLRKPKKVRWSEVREYSLNAGHFEDTSTGHTAWTGVYTPELLGLFTTTDQWLTYARTVRNNGRLTAQHRIDVVLESSAADTPEDRYAELFGNPLGDLD